MKVTFLTNGYDRGWHPDDLDMFLGGNEQCLVLLCRELRRRGHQPEVYTTLRAPTVAVEDFGTIYRHREDFDRSARYECLVSYKTQDPWWWRCAADLRLHCSADVEPPWPAAYLAQLDGFTYMSSYHRLMVPWVPKELWRYVPLALPVEFSVKRKPVDRVPNLMLYATSPDRGLVTLLADWNEICARYAGARLLVTYDLSRVRVSPQTAQLLQQPGVSVTLFKAAQMPEVYGRASYLVHPLNRVQSDLYGYGALQAQTCGCLPVLPFDTLDGTGFQDSVPRWVAYRDFLAGNTSPRDNAKVLDLPKTWSQCVEQYWLPLLGKEVARAS